MRFTTIATVACAVLAMSLLSACGSPSPTPPSPTHKEITEPSGEIWEWALGRNVWTDPDLQQYTQDLGKSSTTDVIVHSKGFELTAEASGTVVAVTVFNDEDALGFPPSDTSMSAYEGMLPKGLSWSDTAADLDVGYGAANQSGGYGTAITFTYSTNDGHDLVISFAARHEEELPTSKIHSIKVTSKLIAGA